MLVQYYYPQTLSPDRLDRYLADGWFRGANMLCRSQLVCFEEDLFSVMNIRLSLEEYGFRKSLRKLINRNGRIFQIEIDKASVNEAKEQLYQQQKHRFKGFIFETLSQFLYSDYWQSVFETYEVCVYDGDKLVAVSYFDMGKESIASILGLHDAAYKKYSLGMYTMLMEVQYAMESNMKFYYPGYILDNYPKFDYKLRLGPMEHYDWYGNWEPMAEVEHNKLAGNVLKKRMTKLQQILAEKGIRSEIVLNPFFSIGYLDQIEEDFLQSSIFLHIEPNSYQDKWLIAEYEADMESYSLCWVEEKYQYGEYFDVQLSKDMTQENARMISDLEHIAECHEVEELLHLIQNQLLLSSRLS
jgi:arginine-tRNA-protein transferase